MMHYHLIKSEIRNNKSVQITGSKSESNRLLILQALFPEIYIQNLSNSDDTIVLQKALKDTSKKVDIHHAGTAMRFLTAYLSIQENKEFVLTGSSRMQERPIAILVDALQDLGASISFEKEKGFPPLKIEGKKLVKNEVVLKANISSQYISALLLIGGSLENGLSLNLEGEITSVPYIKMTLKLLNEIGIQTDFKNNVIKVFPKSLSKRLNEKTEITVESDWSSASYFYSIIALSKLGTKIRLSSYKTDSLQGDSILSLIYKQFGVETIFEGQIIIIEKKSNKIPQLIELDLSKSPDIAQTISVTCLGLNVSCKLLGLHTLKIKETDRLVALKNELEKLGSVVEITNESLVLNSVRELNKDVLIKTYQDHRMAMAFAPLALKTNIKINEPEVVSKSYPTFWNDLELLGFTIKK